MTDPIIAGWKTYLFDYLKQTHNGKTVTYGLHVPAPVLESAKDIVAEVHPGAWFVGTLISEK